MVEEKREKLKVGKRFNSLFMKWAPDVRLKVVVQLKNQVKTSGKFFIVWLKPCEKFV